MLCLGRVIIERLRLNCRITVPILGSSFSFALAGFSDAADIPVPV